MLETQVKKPARLQRLKDGFARFTPTYILFLVAFISGLINMFLQDANMYCKSSDVITNYSAPAGGHGSCVQPVDPIYASMQDFFPALMFGCIVAAILSLVFCLWRERIAQSGHWAPKCEHGVLKALRTPIALWTLSLVLALGFSFALYLAIRFDSLTAVALVKMVGAGLSLAAIMFGMWLLYDQDNKQSLAGFAIKSFAFAFFVAIVVQLGLSICVISWDYFILSSTLGLYDDVSMFAWLIVFPGILCALLPRRGDSLSFSKLYTVFVEYVAFPLFGVLLFTLYAYTATVIVKWEMPVGEFDWFGSFAFLSYFILWLCLLARDDKVSAFFVRWGWIFMIPVAVTQGIGLYIRIEAYGFTPLRYFSFALYILSLVILVFHAFKLKPRVTFAFLAAASLALSLTPLNPYDVSLVSQSSRLQSMLEEEGMIAPDGSLQAPTRETKLERQRDIISAYECIQDNPSFYLRPIVERGHGEILKENIDFEGFFADSPGGYEEKPIEYGDMVFLSAERSAGPIPVEGYTQVVVDLQGFAEMEEQSVVTIINNDYVESIDVSGLLKFCLENRDDNDSLFLTLEHASIELDNGNVFVVSFLNARYETNTDGDVVLEELDIRGTLLIKDDASNQGDDVVE